MAMEDTICEDLRCCLTHKSSGVRLNAVKALHRLVQKEYEQALAAASARQDDGDVEVRCAVIGVLAALARAKIDDVKPIKLLIARLADWEAEVRQLAVDTLAQVTRSLDDLMLSEVRAHLSSWRTEVRRAAVCALTLMAKRGDDHSVEALCSCVSDTDAEVRSMAIRALPKLASTGSQAVAEGLEEQLRSERTGVRLSAAQGIGRVVGQGVRAHPQVRRLLLQHVEDSDVEVRRAAVEAIAQSSEPGDVKALNALCSRLAVRPEVVPKEWWDSDELQAAEEAESESEEEPEEGEEKEEEEEVEPEEDESWVVRKAVLEALTQVAEPGDPRTIEIVVERLQDESSEVRRAAVDTLLALSDMANRHAICGAAECLKHPLADVRLMALHVLKCLIPQDDPRAITVLLEHTGRGEGAAEVRRAALEALPHAVLTFNTRAAQAAIDCMSDHSAETRLTALRVLLRLLPGPDGRMPGAAEPPPEARSSRLTSPRPVGRPQSARPQFGPRDPTGGSKLRFNAGRGDLQLGMSFSSREPPEPVVVTDIRLYSWADYSGVQLGDMITDLNVTALEDMDPAAFEKEICVRPLRITVRRPPPSEAPPPPEEPPPGPPPEKVKAAALATLIACLRDRDARVRALASQALDQRGGEPEVHVQAMRTKQCLPLDS